MTDVDLERLDDVAALGAVDPAEMLRAVATSAAQVRASLTAVREASLGRARLRRPTAGDRRRGHGRLRHLRRRARGDRWRRAARCRSSVHRGYGLPGWVGAADLVIAVSCSGTTAETLSGAAEAARRGARLLGVGSGRLAAGAALPERRRRVRADRQGAVAPRASLWALAVPLLVVAARFGLLDLGPATGDSRPPRSQLESIATLCGPDRESFTNPAKALAAELAGTPADGLGHRPGRSGGRAARGLPDRRERQVAGDLAGALPEAHHNQSVRLRRPLAGGSRDDDLFRDRVEDDDPLRLRLVLLRDDDGDEIAKQRARRLRRRRARPRRPGVGARRRG